MPRRYRSAVTGEFVTKDFADKNPRITVGENRKKPKKGPSGKGKGKKK